MKPVKAGVKIRPGTSDDLELVAKLDRNLHEYQAGPPSFSGVPIASDEEFRVDWSDLWDDADTYTHFVAERNGMPVGHLVLYRRPTGDLRVPNHNIDLSHAVTLPAARRSGVSLALTGHALTWAHENGFRSMTIDWRSVNLLSSRFWPRRGFRPTYYRLYRALP
jgi:GNAT superfamily N-acetyltransferase